MTLSASPGGPGARACSACGAELAPGFVACPACHTLVHAAELKQLAADAARAEESGAIADAVALWERMLALLPPGSLQHQRIGERLASGRSRLAQTGGAPAAKAASSRVGKRTGWVVGLGAAGALLLKFKWALLFVLGKGKLLLAGLFQAKTFLSMGLALWVYVITFGWKFAVGLVVSIYIHEMGHVAWLRHYGIPATAPMFIPGVGAFVRLRAAPQSAAQDARIGMAGPLWGSLAAVGALAIGWAAGWPGWIAIGTVGAWINLFNLVPIWQLDGGRAWNALSRAQRGVATAVLWVLALLVGDGMFFLLAIAGSGRLLIGRAPDRGDRGALAFYVALVAGLALLVYAGRGVLPGGG